MMAKDTLGAAKEFVKKEEEEGLLLFEAGSQINLVRRLIERAFIEGAAWALDRVNEEARGANLRSRG